MQRSNVIEELIRLNNRRKEILKQRAKYTKIYLERDTTDEFENHIKRIEYKQRLEFINQDLKYIDNMIRRKSRELKSKDINIS